MSVSSPGVVRRWVLPILRIVVFAAIAVALVKLAFFNGATSGTDGIVPTAEVSDPITTVQTGSIRNDISLDATVYPDAAAPVRATTAGEVSKVDVAVGAAVDAGTAVVVVKHPLATAAADGTPLYEKVTISAGAAGTLSALTVLVGQQVAVGDTIAQVAPPTFNVTGTIAPVEQYRLLTKPTEATVTIAGGPAPFTCTGLTINAPLAGAAAGPSPEPSGDAPGTTGPSASGSGSSTGPSVRCAVPAGVTVFGGLAAKLTISAGAAADALVVPATAVEGSGTAGTIYRPAAGGGAPKPVKVELGIFDGRNVQIVSGLKEGEEILEFVPSKSDEQAAAAMNGLGG
ncbi:hypothetical protein AB4Z18_14410 [Leifsonia sp. 2TAF2]|uniref:hypothetical protein n=1 Tax=Leifsonia sp. 2TAF2 TaxID=3233009 RepID=UPI003F9D0C84